MSSFTQISLSVLHGNLQHMMPVSYSYQFDTLGVRPVPEQYLPIIEMQGDHHLLVPRYRYTWVSFMKHSWNGFALVHGSNPLICHTMLGPDGNKSGALCFRLIPGRIPALCGTVGRLPVTGPTIKIYIYTSLCIVQKILYGKFINNGQWCNRPKQCIKHTWQLYASLKYNETSMESQYVDIGKPYNRHEAVSGQLSHRLLKSFIRY